MTANNDITHAEQIAAAIIASRMDRVDACDWASPAVCEVLAEYAADLRESIPLAVGFDRIRRAIEADRAATDRSTALRLAS